jgi:hypothetical protein
MMTNFYDEFDEINAELQEMARRSVETDEAPTKLLYIGSGEDFDMHKAKACILQSAQ